MLHTLRKTVKKMNPLVIDGSTLEGGGQLLRNSVTLSVLFSRPIVINNIRQGRKTPGLKRQHAAGLQVAAEICNAKLSGCEVGSTSIDFHPQDIQQGKSYLADPGTAGSITLLMQVSMPCLIFARSTQPAQLILRGGTNATQAPQIDYTQHIFLPFLSKHFGLNPMLEVHKRGYYPKGGGEIRMTVPSIPGPLHSINLTERGALKSITGRAWVAGLPAHLAGQLRNAASSTLVSSGIDPALIAITAVRENDQDAVGSGSGVILVAETENGCRIGGSALGMKGKSMSVVAQEAAKELLRNLEHEQCVDEYLQDQIIIFLALAKGRSVVRTGPLTLHTRTAIWVAEQLTGAQFDIQEDISSSSVLLSCNGVGYTRPDNTVSN